MQKLLLPFLLPLLLVLLPSCQSIGTPASATGGHPPLPTVKRVDLKRYAGSWHEVARLPQSYEKDCLQATAEYTPNPDGTLKVVNTCYKKRGRVTSIEGKAEAVPGSRNARLKVSFHGLAALAPVPDEGNYWIIGLDPGYQWAMVGTPDRQSLWILSRVAALPYPTYQMLKEKARSLGFDTGKLLPEAAAKKRPG
nr:lipocalin-like domain protein [uncultured bacterium]AIA10880.1 lipocalin-like domain protein [uncultured bacterium]